MLEIGQGFVDKSVLIKTHLAVPIGLPAGVALHIELIKYEISLKGEHHQLTLPWY